MPPSPPPPALAVVLILNQTNPYIELTFNDARYSKKLGPKHKLIIGANRHLDSIRLEQSSLFGIRFLKKEDAQRWYDAVEAPWCNLFSRTSSTSLTVWIQRGFSRDDLNTMMPLPTAKRSNSWWNEVINNNHDDDDDRGKSHASAVAGIANGLSKMVKKAGGKGERRY
jgi:hypothetical protein